MKGKKWFATPEHQRDSTQIQLGAFGNREENSLAVSGKAQKKNENLKNEREGIEQIRGASSKPAPRSGFQPRIQSGNAIFF